MTICISRSGCPACGADLQIRITQIEGASPSRANTEQPLVRPPVESTENLPRSPDRLSIPKLASWVENQILVLEMCGKNKVIQLEKVLHDFKYIFQQLNDLEERFFKQGDSTQ